MSYELQTNSSATKTENQRVMERITGYKNAVASIKSRASMFNESNGAGRMVVSRSGLRAVDQDGSGEYYEAKCTNSNDALSSDDETYEVLTRW